MGRGGAVRLLRVSGALPASMVENSGPDDWAATLALFGDLGGLTAIEVLGRDALAFSVRLLADGSALVLAPGAPADFEALLAAGRPPALELSLRFVFEDGSVVDDPTPLNVAVLDRDDTAPTGLAFASGGALMAGAIGVEIGRLLVTDPDSEGPFTFTFSEWDEWRFEVVGSVLKLRDGISLGLDDMPLRPLFVTVSDGRQSAAFQLDLRVLDPQVSTWLTQLPQGASLGGIRLAGEDRVLAMRESAAIAVAEHLAGGERVLTLAEGTQVTLPATERVTFLDGVLDSGAQSPGIRAAALHQALAGREADAGTLAGLVERAEAGVSWTELAAAPGLGALPPGDAAAVAVLYRNALGRDPGAEELALQIGRLASGLSRAQLAVDLALSGESLARQPAEGVWVADPLGEDGAWRTGQGGLPGPAGDHAALPAFPVPDMIWML